MFFSNERNFSLADYLNNSLCDEIGDVNLKKNTYRSIYHLEGKYFTAVTDGTFASLYSYIIKYGVHPDDVQTFIELMDPEHMKERQEKSKTPNFRFAQFRYQLSNGSWRWVEQCILSGKENGLPDNVYRFYIFDIENQVQKEFGNSFVNDSFAEEERNALTGLLNEKHFFKKAQKIIDEQKEADEKICLLKLDIEHFKFFDEWYGREVGNDLLKKIGGVLSSHENENAIAGYLGQDDFCMVLRYDLEEINQIYEQVREKITSYGFAFGFNPAIGVVLTVPEEDVTYTFDKATIAASTAKKDSKTRIVLYNSDLRSKTDHEFKTISDFMKALQNDRIIFYLQPQCRISTKKIVGAEALTRWVGEDGNIIPPKEFIPALEKYGFITDLDKYIWEKVCIWLRKRLNEKKSVIPVSVNVSQVDIYNIDIVEFFNSLIKKYKLPPRLLKIEITESAFAENTDKITDIIAKLKESGFIVMMDDFGSGYSSLNMLANLKFDVIKLDSTFLRKGDDVKEYQKAINVLESVINMTKLVALPIVVEGVERKDQCDFLQNLGVRYIQGFYFYKPIPVEKLEKIIETGDAIDEKGFVVKLNEQFRMREFLDQNVYSDAMLNNVLGAVAIYGYKNNSVDIVRFNQQFYDSVHVDTFHDRLKGIEQFIPEFERYRLFKLLEEAKANKLQGSTGQLRFYRPDGTLMTYIMHFWYLGVHGDEDRFYGSANNITDYVKLQQQMNLIYKFASSSIVFCGIDGNGTHFDIAAHGLEEDLHLSKEQFSEELANGKFYTRIKTDDLKELKKIMDWAISRHNKYSCDITIKLDNGEYLDLIIQADPILDDPITGYSYVLAFRKK